MKGQTVSHYNTLLYAGQSQADNHSDLRMTGLPGRYHHLLRTLNTIRFGRIKHQTRTHNLTHKKFDRFLWDNIMILWSNIKYQHFNKKYILCFYLHFMKLIFYNEKLNILGSNFRNSNIWRCCYWITTLKICLPLVENLIRKIKFCFESLARHQDNIQSLDLINRLDRTLESFFKDKRTWIIIFKDKLWPVPICKMWGLALNNLRVNIILDLMGSFVGRVIAQLGP